MMNISFQIISKKEIIDKMLTYAVGYLLFFCAGDSFTLRTAFLYSKAIETQKSWFWNQMMLSSF